MERGKQRKVKRTETEKRIKRKNKLTTCRRKVNEPLFKLSLNIKALVYAAFKNRGFTKNTKTAEILGCSFEEFQSHIQKQFKGGMSWSNHGDWHIDHIIPVASAIDEEELYKLNHFSNLQPLWRDENLKKGDNFNEADKKKYLEWYSKNVIS